MKYYFFDGTFKTDRPTGLAFKEALDAHHAYLKPYFDNGNVLASGPKTVSEGGIILIRFEDDFDPQEFCKNDPFVKSGVQEYNVVEFKVFDIQEYAKAWL